MLHLVQHLKTVEGCYNTVGAVREQGKKPKETDMRDKLQEQRQSESKADRWTLRPAKLIEQHEFTCVFLVAKAEICEAD
jgi:hypothetical protein